MRLIAVFLFAIISVFFIANNAFSEGKVFKNDLITFTIPDGWVENTKAEKVDNENITTVIVLTNEKYGKAQIFIYGAKKGVWVTFNQSNMRVLGLGLIGGMYPDGQTQEKKEKTIKTGNNQKAEYELWNGIVKSGNLDVNFKSPMATIKPKKGNGMWVLLLGMASSEYAVQIEEDFMKILNSIE